MTQLEGTIYGVGCGICEKTESVNSQEEANEWWENHEHQRLLTNEEVDLIMNNRILTEEEISELDLGEFK